MVGHALFGIIVAIFLFALISRKMDGSIITPPMLFAAIGYLMGSGSFGMIDLGVDHHAIQLVAELTLIMVLFTDASRINVAKLRDSSALPIRMLALGLPLTMAFGAAIAVVVFPDYHIWEACLLAALLAPTDAALGQSVVASKDVPIRIRQTINIESGLNDGISLPVVLMFATLSSAMMGNVAISEWVDFAAMQILLGPVAGILVGGLGALLLNKAVDHKWIEEAFLGIAALALAIMSYLFAEIIEGNGFIAAFVAGGVFGNVIKESPEPLFHFMEGEGALLTQITFLIFGAVLLPEALEQAEGVHLFYALLSLTVIRMLPIAVSLLGTRLQWPSYLFLGWFGPRGLASILFLLLIFERAQVPHATDLLAITGITVALSILSHGISAAPLARWYGAYVGHNEGGSEGEDSPVMPLRDGSMS